jgi:DNA-binding response OmpR family regulator
LMLTGKNLLDNKEHGLDAGADDYLTKPFHVRELLARIRALLRRPEATATSNVLSAAGIELDASKHSVQIDGVSVNLTRKEFQLLEFLMRYPNEIFSSEALFERVWKSDSEASVKSVKVYIMRLRERLGKAGATIQNVHGFGYTFKP